MNVALFPSLYHPHVGGVESMARHLAAGLRGQGHGVAVFTNRWPRSLPLRDVVDDVPVHRLAMRIADGSAKAAVTAAAFAGLTRRAMVRELCQSKADVLNVHCVSVNAAYALHAKQALGLPLVVTLHGELTMDATQLFQRSAWAKRTLRDALDAADAITACSGQTLAEAEAWYGRPFGDRGRVIHNGISLADAGAAAADPWPHPTPYVLAIGRHVPQKGFDGLLRAMKQLVCDREWPFDLVLAGDGPEHEPLKALAAHLGVSDRVTFVGRVDRATAARLFAGCAFFVLPSRLEPFGIVTLEAMAAGKAAVASNVGGVPEVVVDGTTGLLVPPGDAAALADAMLRLATDAALRDRLGTAGRARAARFSWTTITSSYTDVYRRVLRTGSYESR